MEPRKTWLDWAIELQSIAQAGLRYSENKFDLDRFTRIRQISAEMIADASGLPIERVTGLFCNESGYQTPKLDTRCVLFRDGRVLLVRELSGRWALPGGWCEVNLSPAENARKEAREEAGLTVTVDRLVAALDRNRHNTPRYAYGITILFFLCTIIGGQFEENIETTESAWFLLEDLPSLAEEKTTAEEIRICYEAYTDPSRPVIFD